MVSDLLKTSVEQRGPDWENEFLKALCESDVHLVTQEIQTGPDGFPYLMVSTSPTGEGIKDSFQKLVRWGAEQAVGIVVNPENSDGPDYVFSYGMLWHFRKTGLFYKMTDGQDFTESFYELKPETRYEMVEPTEELFPNEVKTFLKDYYTQQGVADLKYSFLKFENEPDFDVIISLDSLGNPEENEHEGIMMATSWFFPPHYRLMLLSEDTVKGFQSL